MSVGVLFVCLGNICRSPTAHGVFQRLVDANGLSDAIVIDSAGTGDWHVGRAPDARTCAAAQQRGYDLCELRARQVTSADFQRFDYILAMDSQNLRDLQRLRPRDYRGELALFLDYGQTEEREVPDPYHGAADDFERVLDLIEEAAAGLLQAIQSRHSLPRLRR